MTIKRLIHSNEIKGDKTLKTDDGWVKMDVKWLVSEDASGSELCVCGRTIFGPGGGAHELHTHPNAEEVLYILKGHGIAISGDEEFEIGPGDCVFVPKNQTHFFKNTDPNEDLDTIWFYGGQPSLAKAGYKPIK